MDNEESDRNSTATPDADVEAFTLKVQQITEAWAKRHDLWHDSSHKDPVAHYNDDPGSGGPILLLCSDGPAMSSLEWDDDAAQELRHELEQVGVFLEMDDRVTAGYYLVDDTSDLRKRFDEFARWKWICKLIEADTADVSEDLYRYFATNPQEVRRLPPREFEKLISSIFAARGWRTELGPGSGDNGVDLRIWQCDPLGDLLTLVQIKRYAPDRPINLEAVAALESHVSRENATRGLFVTSSRYLPGVKKFADRNKHRLQLADASDLRKWCEVSAYETRAARNRALAMDDFAALMQEIRSAPSHPRLLTGGRFGPCFCVVLRETGTSALLAHIPKKIVSGDLQCGAAVPLLDGTIQESPLYEAVFRASRSEENGAVSYWGQRTLYYIWDGKPRRFDDFD